MTAHEERRWQWLQFERLERWWQSSRHDELHEDDADANDDRITTLTAALAQLSKRQQEVLHLVFYQSLTIQDAAIVLAMPVGTARTHYERGKARLRALIGEEGQG